MKTTSMTTYRTLLQNLTRGSTRLNDWRIKTATGKRLNKPSDDPTAIRPVLNARTQISASERYLRTMDTVQDRLDNAEGYLYNTENILVRVKELAISAGDGAYSPEDLTLLADELALRREELLDAANANIDGKFIFAGYQDNVQPFVLNDNYDPAAYNADDPSSWSVHYKGDPHAIQMEIGPGALVDSSVPGNELFLGLKDTNGDGTLEQTGTDLFGVLDRMEQALRANDPDTVIDELGTLDEGADQVRRLHGSLGIVGQRLDTARDHMETLNIDMQTILSRYEDIDLVEAVSNMTQEEMAFDAALKVSARVQELNILKYF
ncbi:MAG: flagellar hook-associated protein FlgL [Desulfuromonadales bacterium]|nr:flagellar hook-associated protein FlgL [Desulfuromonadales bacterium]MDW7757239.1 flagellar hook-associated protein FlgL [Desulfuromonadales bacterium]